MTTYLPHAETGTPAPLEPCHGLTPGGLLVDEVTASASLDAALERVPYRRSKLVCPTCFHPRSKAESVLCGDYCEACNEGVLTR